MSFPLLRSVPSLGAVALVCLPVCLAAAPADGVTKLTPDDYIEIQQLDAKYAFAIETCTNSGYDYADLYLPDGEFGVASDWGQTPKRAIKGRDALANADNGGPGGCRDPKTFMGAGLTHLIVNTVITPTPTGATSREYLLTLGVGDNPMQIESQGGYESTYVKTPKGWRYKTRYHVFPNMANSIQFGPGSPLHHLVAPPDEQKK